MADNRGSQLSGVFPYFPLDSAQGFPETIKWEKYMATESPALPFLVPFLEQRAVEARERAEKLQTQFETAREEASLYERVLALERIKSPSPTDSDDGPDRWKLFEEFCVLHAAEGFTRPEIFTFFQERGLTVGKNFPYYAVDKWADRLTQRGGKYYLNSNGTMA
jgi:hypothetical protein